MICYKLSCILIFGLFVIERIAYSAAQQPSHQQNEILPSSGYAANSDEQYLNNNDRGGRAGWMDTAKNALSGPAGQLLVHFTKEMISRSAGTSQVLSLNLTNLLILVFLKALIFSAGLIGAGNWSQYSRGRSIGSNALIQPSETPLFIGFLAAEGSGDETCLHNAACLAPETATEYLRAAKAILKGAEMFETKLTYSNMSIHYRDIIQKTERAVLDGMAGAPCDAIYSCRL